MNTIGIERDAVIGHHFLEIIKHDSLFADLKTCLETGKSIVYELRDNVLSFHRDQKTVYLEYFFSPVLSGQKELLGALFLLRDITNLKELDRLKSEFVMIVSHELKTPLTSINMSIDLLRESLGQSPKTEDLELIDIAKEEINHLRILISDLLDLSKIEAGKLEMSFDAADPDALMDSVGQYFRNQIAEKNGMGIALPVQNKIFDRFFQVEDQKAARGTGLGLTISREIVRAHGGSIWVESSPGRGTTFNFTIPLEPQTMS